jgi:HAD superfamily hydrolase (TIGR01549 family)
MHETSCTPAKRSVRAILLDAGGVILHPNLDWLAERAAEEGEPLGPERLFFAYYRTMREVDDGATPRGQGAALTNLEIRVWFFSRMLYHAGVARERAEAAGQHIAALALQELPRESDLYHWTLPGTRSHLERLQRSGFALGVASNNDGALETQLRNTGLLDCFGVALDSGIEGVAKPDPELLWRAARGLGVPPKHCLFIGDVDRVDGQAARAAGMAFALLDPLGQERPSRPLLIPDLEAIHDHFVALPS